MSDILFFLMRPWLNWIEHRSTEPKVTGSNPVGRGNVSDGQKSTSDTVSPDVQPILESDTAKSPANLMQEYPDLALIAETWPNLPEHIRAAIIAMVQHAKSEQ